MKKKNLGFTLIELMITLVIVAILASIAIPSYSQYVLKANRAEAQSTVMEISGAMERYYASKYTYVGAVLGAAGTDETSVYDSSVTPAGATGTEIKYQLSLSNLSEDGYTVNAVPRNTQTKDTCGGTTTADGATTVNGFSLSSKGQKSPADCW